MAKKKLRDKFMKIKLTKGKFALIDTENYAWLNQWKWYSDNSGYASRPNYLGKINGKYKQGAILMHRLINQTPQGMQTDHINRNKLDNRKENLRTVTASQNKINTNLRSDNTSGYKGIYWNKINKKWMVDICLNQKTIYLGSYSNIQVAWLARRWGERTYFDQVTT